MNVVNVEFRETSSQIGWDDSRRKSKFSIYYSGQFNFTTLSNFIKVPGTIFKLSQINKIHL